MKLNSIKISNIKEQNKLILFELFLKNNFEIENLELLSLEINIAF